MAENSKIEWTDHTFLNWQRIVTNHDSPYAEDRRIKYVSTEYEITKEGDGRYWLRHQGKPIGMSKRLRDAKEAARRHFSTDGET